VIPAAGPPAQRDPVVVDLDVRVVVGRLCKLSHGVDELERLRETVEAERSAKGEEIRTPTGDEVFDVLKEGGKVKPR
jgi:hypothetical protein